MKNEEVIRNNEWTLCPACQRPYKFLSLIEMTTGPNLLVCPDRVEGKKKE